MIHKMNCSHGFWRVCVLYTLISAIATWLFTSKQSTEIIWYLLLFGPLLVSLVCFTTKENWRLLSLSVPFLLLVLIRSPQSVSTIVGYLALYLALRFGTNRIIAQHAVLDQQVRQQERFLQNIVDGIPNYVIVKDKNGCIILINQAAAAFHGETPETLTNRSHDNLWGDGQESQRYFCDDQAVIANGRAIQSEPTTITNAQGDAHIIQMIKLPIAAPNGLDTYVLGTGIDLTASYKAETGLRTQWKFFEELVDSLPNMLFVKDQEGKYILINRAIEEHDGIRKADVLGKTDMEVKPGFLPGDSQAFIEEDRAIIEGKLSIHGKFEEKIDIQGNHRTFQLVKRAIKTKDDNKTYVLGVLTDVTDLIQTKQALEDNEAYLRSIMAGAPLVLNVADVRGIIALSEGQGLQRLGLAAGQLVGQSIFNLYADRPELLGHLEAVLDGEEQTWVSRDDAEVSYESRAIPMRNKRGEVTGIISISTDVTERRQAERSLEAERSLLQTLMDNLPDFIFVKDRQSRYLMANAALIKRMGKSTIDEVVGKRDFDFFPEPITQEFFDFEQQVMADGKPHLNRYEVLGEGESQLWALASKIPIVNSSGEVTGLINISRDITEIKKTEFELRKAKDAAEAADRAKTQFLATISHEIRTPMNAILGMTLLLRDTELTAEQQEFLETIRSSADTLMALIINILDFSKVVTGNIILDRHSFNTTHLVKNVVDSFAAQAGQKGMPIKVHQADNVPEIIVGDSYRVRQILVNLISNALKFTHVGQISVNIYLEATASDAEKIYFSVQDTGIGIVDEKQKKIFELFYQADSSTNREYDGTGIGLAISRQLCLLMGGDIHVKSKTGIGSRFTFWIPLERANGNHRTYHEPQGKHPATLPSEPTPVTVISEPTESERLSLLIVEDNLINQKVLLQMLKRLGYRADIAENGREAVEALSRKTYHLLLMDLQMPEMDGLEATRIIRETHHASQQPFIVAVTANAMAGDRERCLTSGMDEYISKPIQISSLAALLEQISSVNGKRTEGFVINLATTPVSKKSPQS